MFAYGAAYLPLHLEHERRPATDGRRFWPWMTLFMVSMVGLACARDLIVLFVFFDLTAVASYFLIGFDRDRREARGAALMALLVTGVTAVALLLGAVLLYDAYGTFSLPELFERARPGTTTAIAGALIAVAALAKSAQVPLHFWLPRAMAAPTPVSAYLHSAAMVAAGVLVLGRVHPLLALNQTVLDGLLVVGLASIVIGGAAGARPGRAQADPRPLDDLAIRVRRRPLRDRRRRRRGRRRALCGHARDRQERAVHDRRRRHRGDRRDHGSRSWAGWRAGCPSSPPRAPWRPRRSPRCR